MHEYAIRRGWVNENEENKTQKTDFILEIRSLMFFLIIDPFSDQIC